MKSQFSSAGSDYETINETITFDIEDLQYEGTLKITDNDALENVEQMFLQIEAVPGPFPLMVLDDTATVTIADNDGEKHLTLWWLFSTPLCSNSFSCCIEF